MLGNIIDTGKTLKLIDWEYSANSDPRFDLAMFSVKEGLSKRHDTMLLKAYGSKIPPEQFAAMKAVVHFREGAWGLVQLAISEIPFDYRQYSKENLAAFKRLA
jgi:thiamine kinase-like enzyme